MPCALAVTAHHDDAVLWAGGTIRRTHLAGWDWTVIASCVPDPARRTYFTRWCEAVGVEGITLPFADYMGEGGAGAFSRNDEASMREQILSAVHGRRHDWVFTHRPGPDCEYGYHANHDEAARIAEALAVSTDICEGLSRVVHFSYMAIYGGGGLPTVGRVGSSRYLQLTYDELRFKLDWCAQAPDQGNLRNLGFPCPNPEAFSGTDVLLPNPFVG